MKKILLIIFFIILMNGCGQKTEPQTPTSGYITVKGSEQTLSMMTEQAYAFMDLYTKAKILVLDGGSNFGLAAIFMDSAQIAVSTRPMTDEERKRAVEASFQVYEYKICKDGIAIVVNPVNPIKKLTSNQIVNIFTGKVKNWSEIGGRNWPVKTAIWGENAGTYAFFQDSILKGNQYSKNARRFENTEAMVKYIEKEKGAIGMISMARLYVSWSPLIEDTRIKPLAISQDPKAEYVLPDEAVVYEGKYPLVRYIYLYTARDPKGLDGGFITFITSSAGQKIIAANGFVPITVPVKYKKDSL